MTTHPLITWIKDAVNAASRDFALPEEANTVSIDIERPRSNEHGDWSTNVAMLLSKTVKMPPRKVADLLLPYLSRHAETFEKIEIAGPGFINFTFHPAYWFSLLSQVFEKTSRFGEGQFGRGKRALVEFVSANPTGPLHVGHGRGAVVGDTMATILSWAGYQVEREYYLNDGGVQMNMLGASIAARYLEQNGKPFTFPENGYRGTYIYDVARALSTLPNLDVLSTDDLIAMFGDKGGDMILAEIFDDLKCLGISFDHLFRESSLYKTGAVERTLKRLHDLGLTYDLDGALWFKTSEFGDDKDRVLRKQDGSYTYFTPDIAYHCDKLDRGYDLFVNVWGADHGGYVPRMKAAFASLGMDKERLQVLLIQMVHLISKGEKVNMSTRAGEFEELATVRKDVGADACRYFFLMRSYSSQLDFDIDLARSRSSENPVYYIQYAHARIASIFKKRSDGKEDLAHFLKNTAFVSLNPASYAFLPEELALMKKVIEFQEVLEMSARELEPHRPAFYLLELAKTFQTYYSRARQDKRYQVLSASPEEQIFKLAILAAVGQTLANGLTILGISAPEEM